VLRTRVLTALVALPALLALVLFAPAAVFSAFVGLITAWGLYEVGAMTAAIDAGTIAVLAAAGCASALMVWLAPGYFWFLSAGVVIGMLILVIVVAGGDDRLRPAPNGTGLTIIGAFYVGALFPYFALLRNRPDGIPIIILVLLLVMASDTGAYFAGSLMGRTKLAPRVSPKKTLEGAFGGLLLSVVAGMILRQPLVAGWGLWMVVGFSAAVAILAQMGDLAGSAFKRCAGVKDSGWIFPGHGGLIDRTCSMVFAVVLAYYWAQ
jgi:phosphatidate cytidylyltransferase